MGPVLLAVAAVAYNTLANRWAPFRGWAYVPMNLAAAAAVWWVGTGPLGLSGRAIGFGPGWGTDLLAGVALGAAVAAPVFLAARHPRTRRLVADERVRGLDRPALIYRVLVRVPVGTALLEELAFRGVLYAAWRPNGALAAAIASSVPFGLWHVSPTLNLVEANRPDAGHRATLWAVVGAVAVTTAAGVGLAGLREATGSLGTVLGLHAAMNSLTTLAAAGATRAGPRARSESG